VSVALGQLPWERPALPAAEDTAVGRDGVAVMRWLRSQTGQDDLLATNGHTLTPASDLQLAFWLAGYTERRVLVESWGYTIPYARIMADTGLGFDEVPFWDQELLRLNDRAFTDPTTSGLEELHREHGVSWLVLDRRFPSDPEAVSRLLQPAYSRGDYVVYDLRGALS
jgi:hypothetical protein